MTTAKLQIVGHGIEVARYTYRPAPFSKLKLVTVGRISEVKRIKEMLDVCDQLARRDVPFEFSIYGTAITPADKLYLEGLMREFTIRSYGNSVQLHGPVAHSEVPAILSQANVFLNLSRTGSMDKAILEAMAAGVLPVTTNEAFARIVPEVCFVSDYTPAEVADRLARIYAGSEVYRAQLRAEMQEEAQKHSLTALISTLIRRLEKVS
ncbi:MAG TPA: glycosyltransferase family 4 protein [Candidatus Paceibacterota bacterium]|nr:glycosyltransferase family 4 protein [Candidatus Paceibacterota bacterium]